MELKVIDGKKNRLVFEIKGVDHTLCNLLTKELNNDKNVKLSTYRLAHPLVGNPEVIVETDGVPPKNVIMSAIQRIKKGNEGFLREFLKEVR